MDSTTDIVINELNFTHFIAMGKIVVEKGGIPAKIVEETLKRIALENNLSVSFVC